MSKRHGITAVDLLVGTTVVAILLGFCVLSLGEMRPRPKRVKCAANLRSLVQSMYIYAQDGDVFPAISVTRAENDGAMVIFDPATRQTQPSTTGIPSPTVDLWMLLRTSMAQPKTFICPLTNDRRDPVLDTTAYFDFASPRNLSYAYQFQHDPNRRPISTTSEPTFPLLADGNPYIKGGVTRDVLQDRLSRARGNSKNHGKKLRPGENTALLDGSASYERSPDIGLPGPAHPDLVAEGATRFGNDCYTFFDEVPGAYVDPGAAGPTAVYCNLGGKSDACLVP